MPRRARTTHAVAAAAAALAVAATAAEHRTQRTCGRLQILQIAARRCTLRVRMRRATAKDTPLMASIMASKVMANTHNVPPLDDDVR